MKKQFLLVWLPLMLFLPIGLFVFARQQKTDESRLIIYVVNAKKQPVKFYWKDETGNPLRSIGNLKTWLTKKQQTLLFAMNGGIYQPNRSPVGLYIEGGKILSPIDTSSRSGNFYLKPNGVFYIDQKNNAIICQTENFVASSTIKYATQSGPMLVINGNIHPVFTKGSVNKTIRNGVGILPNGNIIFALSKEPINFFDFANYFRQKGCKNALYLDGFVSRMYLPQQKWVQTDGNFGVMIGVSTN